MQVADCHPGVDSVEGKVVLVEGPAWLAFGVVSAVAAAGKAQFDVGVVECLGHGCFLPAAVCYS